MDFQNPTTIPTTTTTTTTTNNNTTTTTTTTTTNTTTNTTYLSGNDYCYTLMTLCLLFMKQCKQKYWRKGQK